MDGKFTNGRVQKITCRAGRLPTFCESRYFQISSYLKHAEPGWRTSLHRHPSVFHVCLQFSTRLESILELVERHSISCFETPSSVYTVSLLAILLNTVSLLAESSWAGAVFNSSIIWAEPNRSSFFKRSLTLHEAKWCQLYMSPIRDQPGGTYKTGPKLSIHK